MRIPPRYGCEPIIAYQGDPAAVATPAVRQRLRLARTLTDFGPAEWDAPSRCGAWTNRDVVVHLTSGTRFWVHSIGEARRGAPTELLASFDPVATPAGLVAAAENPSPAKALEAYLRSTHALADLLDSLTGDEWTMLGESPLGHVSVSAIVYHALWDAWVHERDIALGVGLLPEVEADEVDAALRCVAALGPAFGLLLGNLGDPDGPGNLDDRGSPDSPGNRQLRASVTTDDPAVGFTVEVDRSVRISAGIDPAVPVALHGCAVDVLEGLSLRAPLDLEPEWRWLTAGLRRSFEAGQPELSA